MISVREATSSDYPKIARLYEKCGYRHGIKVHDLAIVACKENDLIGTVRLSLEHDTLVLRGMQVLPKFQRQGVGKQLLRKCVRKIEDSTSYCVPYSYLEEFYGREGFTRIDPEKAPEFIAERYRSYVADGYDVILMCREST